MTTSVKQEKIKRDLRRDLKENSKRNIGSAKRIIIDACLLKQRTLSSHGTLENESS